MAGSAHSDRPSEMPNSSPVELNLWARKLIDQTSGALHPRDAGPNPAASTISVTHLTRLRLKARLF